MQVRAEIIDGVERRTAYRLAGLEVPEGTAYKFNSQTGTSEVISETPELPSGRALLAHLLREGRGVKERPVQVAKEAAICELLLDGPIHEQGTK